MQSSLLTTRLEKLGGEMYDLLVRLFPICRSITGDGVRQTLRILQEHIPLKIAEIPSGTQAFDWTVPDEWNISDGYILDPDGKKIVDFKQNNLHVLGYSEPVDKKLGLAELTEHLYSLPDYPEAIPYVTSYYKRRWGFCLRHKDLLKLKEGTYTVKIDSTLKPGAMSIGELVLPGEREEEILLSCYTCHPSMANDSISGVVLMTFLGKLLAETKRRYTYRVIFIPETVGAVVYLSRHKDHLLSKTRGGLIASFVGDAGNFRYKKSRRGDAEIDRATANVMSRRQRDCRIVDFYPHLGSDERQYCSPGFNLPVGLLTRTPYLEYPEYHTSLDNLSHVSGKNLGESLALYYDILMAMEINRVYVNQTMYCEPFLSKWNLYSTVGGPKIPDKETMKLKWLLNYSDGEHDLLQIADTMSTSILDLAGPLKTLVDAGLLKPRG